jgi:hypothetical protein
MATAEGDGALGRTANELERGGRQGEDCSTSSGANRTSIVSSSTSAPAVRKTSRASGSSTRIPSCSSTVSAESCSCATWSPLRISIGGNGFSSER